MNAQHLLDEVLGILHEVKQDKQSLEKILNFLNEEIVLSEEPETEVPEKFKGVIPKIASSIDAGLVCYLNLDTLEMEDIPKEWLVEDFDFEMDAGISKEELGIFKHNYWENCMEFEPLESSESFRIMEDFAMQVKSMPIQNKLIQALSNRKPFANFKRIIDNSGEFRQQWFDFKDAELQKHVCTQIYLQLNYGIGTKTDKDSDNPDTLPF